MSKISLSISSKFGSTFNVSLFEDRAICVELHTNIYSGYNDANGNPASHTYAKDHLMIHGNPDDLRRLAEAIAKAVPHDANARTTNRRSSSRKHDSEILEEYLQGSVPDSLRR